MSTGKIKTLFSDKEKTEALFPRTKTSAVSNSDGKGLDAILENLPYFSDADSSKVANVPLNADTLGGHPASDFALAYDVENMTYEDVGAAPAGFGLGVASAKKLTETDDLNTTKVNGWYSWFGNKPHNAPNTYSIMRVWTDGFYVCQEVMTAHVPYTNVIIRRFCSGGSSGWNEWEYVNPPMTPGIEYRTTERMNGKPVYCKYIDGGYLPNTGSKTYTIAENASPFHVFGPSIMTVNFGGNIPSTPQDANVISCFVNGNTVLISCGGDRSSIPFYFVVKYTKTTD